MTSHGYSSASKTTAAAHRALVASILAARKASA